MDIVTNVVQFAATNPVLIFVVGALSVLSLFLTLTVTRQRKQIAILQAPPRRRYGFLGKPLYSTLVVGVMVGGFALTYYATQNTRPVTVNADTNVVLDIQTQVIAPKVEGIEVQFSVVPTVDGVVWGSNSTKFDAFWTAVGPSGFSEIELDISSANPGGFKKTLRSGSYEITVDVLVGERRFNKTINVNF